MEAGTTPEEDQVTDTPGSVIDWQALAARLRVWLREIGAIKEPLDDRD